MKTKKKAKAKKVPEPPKPMEICHIFIKDVKTDRLKETITHVGVITARAIQDAVEKDKNLYCRIQYYKDGQALPFPKKEEVKR
ncbi:MAG TPA: hypothetical protein P5110_07450 [Candidatus Omnitrophota bacterium]|nr:hypothetical protein [Candidatus Omnitrophota bacterium]